MVHGYFLLWLLGPKVFRQIGNSVTRGLARNHSVLCEHRFINPRLLSGVNMNNCRASWRLWSDKCFGMLFCVISSLSDCSHYQVVLVKLFFHLDLISDYKHKYGDVLNLLTRKEIGLTYTVAIARDKFGGTVARDTWLIVSCLSFVVELHNMVVIIQHQLISGSFKQDWITMDVSIK